MGFGSFAGLIVAALVTGGVAVGVGALAAGVAGGAAAASFSAIGTFLTAAGSTLVLGGVSKALAKKPSSGTGGTLTASGRLQMIRQPVSPRQVIIGEVRVGGDLTFFETSTDNQYAHLIITLAGHRCASVRDVYFNDEIVPFDANGDATGKYAGYVRIKVSLGDEGASQPFPDLVSESNGKWTTAHLQRGCTKLYVRLKFSQDLFPTGVPNITAVVRGALIYDSRTGTTGWNNNAALVVAHYLTNSTYGFSADVSTEIDDTTLDAQADICDGRVSLASDTTTFTAEADVDLISLASGSRLPCTGDGVRVSSSGTLPAGLAAATTYYVILAPGPKYYLATTFANALAGTAIDITDAGSGTHTLSYYDEPRYRINAAFRTNETPRNVLQRMLAAMAGSAVNVGGKWFIYAGAYDAPTITLDEGDLAGAIRVQSLNSRRENCNGVKGIFTSPSMSWQPTDFPALASDTYLAEDNNERVWRDVDYSGVVTSGTQAQRLAKIELLRTRQALTVSARFKLTAYRAMTGRTVAITNEKFGWTAKAFEVQASRFVVEGDGTLGVELTLRETASAVYDWSTSEEQAIDIAPNTNLPSPTSATAPGAPTVTESVYATSDARGVAFMATVTWTAPSDSLVIDYQVEYKQAAASSYTVLPKTGGALSCEIADIAAGSYNFRVRAFNMFGVGSSYSPVVTKEIQGLSAAPSAISGLTIQKLGGLAVLKWTRPTDLAVLRGGRIRVRHSEDATTPTWEASFSVGDPEGVPGDSVFALVPLKAGSYLVKAENQAGVQSATATTVVSDGATALAYSALGSVTEDSTFSGSKTNCVLDGTTLKLTGAGNFDDITDFDAISSVDDYGGVNATGTYVFSAGIDLGSLKRVRLVGVIEGLTVNTNDKLDDRSGNIDDWLDFDGSGGGGSTDAYIEVRSTPNNPSGSPTWSAWNRVDASEYYARAFQARLQLRSSDPAYNQYVTKLRLSANEIV